MVYYFKCKKCKKELEIEIPMNEYDELKDKQTCNKCNNPVTRVFKPIGGTFYNCSGFYDTDSRGVGSR